MRYANALSRRATSSVRMVLCLAMLAVAAMTAVTATSSSAIAVGVARAAEEPVEEKRMTVAVMKTSMGDIVLRFFPEIAPKAVENFEGLAKKGYYDGVIFHRVIEGFMIQGGDPLGSGLGGKSIWGKSFENETHPDHVFDRKGILAMANAGKDTNGSQFFITLDACDWLNGGYTIFGEVVEGQDVVDAIGGLETHPTSEKPVRTVTIEGVTFEERVVGE